MTHVAEARHNTAALMLAELNRDYDGVQLLLEGLDCSDIHDVLIMVLSCVASDTVVVSTLVDYLIGDGSDE